MDRFDHFVDIYSLNPYRETRNRALYRYIGGIIEERSAGESAEA
jgi:hypothetical protein